MNLRWKNLEETGDPCNQAAEQEEIFAEISASKRDELDYTHMKLDDESWPDLTEIQRTWANKSNDIPKSILLLKYIESYKIIIQ